jgi:alpha/beta superfamily hydrolase
MIKEMLPQWNREADFKIIQGADHFYWGKTSEIERAIENFLDQDGI